MSVGEALTPSALEIRPYREADEQEVIALLRAALGEGPSGHRSPSFFRWKHLENPFGRSLMLVAEERGRIIGLRAFLRWRFASGDRVVAAVRAVDTATHPEFQGRGIFSRLTRGAIELLRGDADLIYNTPNEKSLPGYLKMGWRVVGRVGVQVRVLRPVRMGMALTGRRQGRPEPEIDAPAAIEALSEESRLAELLASLPSGDSRLATPMSAAYLQWRYGPGSELDYRALWADQGPGLAIFRVRPRFGGYGISIAEVLVPDGASGTARGLLRSVVGTARAEHAVCAFPEGSAGRAAASRTGFVPAPRGVTFVVNPLTERLDPDPMTLEAWALSLGDVEVF